MDAFVNRKFVDLLELLLVDEEFQICKWYQWGIWVTLKFLPCDTYDQHNLIFKIRSPLVELILHLQMLAELLMISFWSLPNTFSIEDKPKVKRVHLRPIRMKKIKIHH